MAKKKTPTEKPEVSATAENPTARIIGRLDATLSFPAEWDRKELADDQLNAIRSYLRDNAGAENIDTESHTTSNKIEGNPRTRQTAIFFAHTVTEGALIVEGANIPPRKGQLVILPAGSAWKIKATTQPREIIEFTF